MNKNFLKEFTKYPSKEVSSLLLKCCLVLNIFFIPLMLFWYNSEFNNENKYLNILLLIYIFIFLILNLILKKLINKNPPLFFLYTSGCFLLFSLSLNYISYNIIYYQFSSPVNIYIIFFSILIYIILLILNFFYINKKLKSDYIPEKKLNTEYLKLTISLFVILGIIISRKININSYFWILLMIMSFCTIPALNGFYKFILLKNYTKIKEDVD